MRKRDEKKERREIIRAFSLILQIGFAMITCIGLCLAIGIYFDRLFGTKYVTIIMLVIGIMAAIRSMLVLTGAYKPGRTVSDKEKEKGQPDEKGEDNVD